MLNGAAEPDPAAGWRPGNPPAVAFDRHEGPLPAASSADLAFVQERLARKVSRLARDGSPALAGERWLGKTAPDSLYAVVLMCDFADSLFYGRHDQFPDFPPPRQSDFYYTAHDSLYYHHLLTDVATYFTAVSDGQFTLRYDVIGTVANLSQPMSYYGNHPDEGEQTIRLAADVVLALDPLVDFSRYDTVILIHAGAGEETDILDDSPEQIFSTYLGPEDFADAVAETLLAEPYLATDDFPPGQGLDQVLILPENEFQDPFGSFAGYFGSLGVYCFEVGLRLGMLSLSDFTPSGSPDSQGIGEFGLMGFGLFVGAGFIPDHPCAFNKMLMGWLDPYPVDPGAGGINRLTPAERAAGPLAAARVSITGQEYWLLEYRLQDPDGNGIFSFAGDLNGNNIPDFRDFDSAFGDGTPSGFFDPLGADGIPGTGDEDQREWLDGAEFDFFMSENPGRPDGVKAAGSGVYIWHVDEGVIQEAFGAERNLFNADPTRKSVDLEEADGIQDLDSRLGSPFILGGDDDSFRGEGARPYDADTVVGTRFGPDTEPGTGTAGGGWTGIVCDQFSNVVVDSTAGEPPRILYADTLSFRCLRLGATTGLPELTAERFLDGIDLRGSHLVAADLDDPADGSLEIVCHGGAGEVFAFTPDLAEHVDRDADPATVVPLVVGTDADGSPVVWNGPAAIGDLDADGLPEIVLTTPQGLYAFNGEDGSEVLDGDGDADSHGLLAPLNGCALPPVLLSRTGGVYSALESVVACVVDTVTGGVVLRWFGGDGSEASAGVELPAATVASAPVQLENSLFLPCVDVGGNGPALYVLRWNDDPGGFISRGFIPLTVTPGLLAPLSRRGDSRRYVVVVPGLDGVEVLHWPDGDIDVDNASSDLWPVTPRPRSAVGAGLALVGEGVYGRYTLAGVPVTGWPRRPQPAVQPVDAGLAPTPLSARISDSLAYVFQSRDGRVYRYSGAGELEAGYPLAGPSATAGTPLLLDLDGDGRLDLAAVGCTDRIIGLDLDNGELTTEFISGLRVWSDLGAGGNMGNWGMWRGNPWRTGEAAQLPSMPGPPPAAFRILAGSHICYPSPLTEGPLHVRGRVSREATAHVTIYNLEGEEVATARGWALAAAEPFEVIVPLAGIASGLYVCRMVVEDITGATETSVVSFAVTR